MDLYGISGGMGSGAGDAPRHTKARHLPADLWTRVPITDIEVLGDAILDAGLEATQMTRQPVTGSLLFAEHEGVVFSSGYMEGRAALRGTLSRDQVTIGFGLAIPPGTKHWLREESTGAIGVFLPDADHDALYAPGSLYAAITFDADHVEELAADIGLVLDGAMLGGTGFHRHKLASAPLQRLERGMRELHAGRMPSAAHGRALAEGLLELAIGHYARKPRTGLGRPDPSGLARLAARARGYIEANLHMPLSVAGIASACSTSRRTLHRAFVSVLGEPPSSYVRRLRLHRIRHELISAAELKCSVAMVAHRWGMDELGRMAGFYREMFGELPSQTRARHRGTGLSDRGRRIHA